MQLIKKCYLRSTEEIYIEIKLNYCKIFMAFLLLLSFSAILVLSVLQLSKNNSNSIAYVTLIVVSGIMITVSLPLIIFRLFIKWK
jgi:hypothetical protein